MLVPLSEGFSKSGADLKVSAPVEESILNLEASVPPFKDQVAVSVAENVWTVLLFSTIDFVLSPLALFDGPITNNSFSTEYISTFPLIFPLVLSFIVEITNVDESSESFNSTPSVSELPLEIPLAIWIQLLFIRLKTLTKPSLSALLEPTAKYFPSSERLKE